MKRRQRSDARGGLVERAIAVLSDRALCRECLVDHLGRGGGAPVHGLASSAALLRLAHRQPVKLALVDLELGAEDPALAIAELRRRSPDTTIVAFGTAAQLAALAGDAHGGVELGAARLRDLTALVRTTRGPQTRRPAFPVSEAVRAQREKWRRLTPRQAAVLSQLAQGRSNQDIAQTLGISERSVKAHISRLMIRFEVTSRTQLALIASRAGLRAWGSAPLTAVG